MQRKWVVFAAVVFGVFVSVVDASATVVALPTLAEAFASDLPTVQWITVGNGLAIAALLVPMGRLGDLVGRKVVYLLGIALFVAGALASWLAGDVAALIGARVLGGLGSAMVQGNSMAILASTFENRERGRVLGMQMGFVGVGGITGPAVGGLVIGTFGWRAIFLMMAVAGVLVFVTALFVLRRRRVRPVAAALAFDWAGAGLSACFLVALLITLSSGTRVGWDSPRLAAGFAAAALLLVAFLWREHTARSPMLALGLFRIPVFSLGVLGTATTFMGLAAMRYLIPFHVQAVLQLDPTQTGLVLVPAAIVTAVASPVTGGLSDRLGARHFAHLGLLLCLLGLLALGGIGPDASVAYVIGAMMLTSFGAAAFHAPNSSSVINAVDREYVGVVSGFTNLARNAGTVTGVAVATSMVSVVMAAQGFEPSLTQALAGQGAEGEGATRALLTSFDRGARGAFWLLAGVVAVVLTLSLRYAGQAVMTAREGAAR